jgi:hypothetical protein
VDNSEAPTVCPLFQRVEGPFYSSRRSVECWGGGSQALMICRHSSWMVLMLAPWSVVSQYPGSVPPDSTLHRCDRISWSGRIYSKSCDAPPLLGNAQDCFGVAVGCMQKWALGSKCFLSHPLDQTDITTINPIHSRCVCGSGNHRVSNLGRVQGRPHLLVRSHLPGVARWLILSPNVYLQVKITTQLVELY